MKNAKLGREVLDVADYDAEHFNMHVWAVKLSCGTIGCLAGTTLMKTGYEVHSRNGNGMSLFTRPDGGEVDYIPDEAQSVLGMTDEEVGSLGDCLWFDYKNGVERFRKLVEAAEKREANEGTILDGGK